MTSSKMKNWLRRFSNMDSDWDGYITREDMTRYLGVPDDACLKAVFAALAEVSGDRGKGCQCAFLVMKTYYSVL